MGYMWNKKIVELHISKDFSKTPGPRYISEGMYSGEHFRDSCLYDKVKQAIEEGTILKVYLDNTLGYATSFLEEAFGGLIIERDLNYYDIRKVLKIVSTEEEYLIDDIKKYLSDAHCEKSNYRRFL
jgi:hypothetical protein